MYLYLISHATSLSDLFKLVLDFLSKKTCFRGNIVNIVIYNIVGKVPVSRKRTINREATVVS